MPAILKEPLMFPYTAGLGLTLRDFAGGGFAAVDALYDNPPDSTEQVLHHRQPRTATTRAPSRRFRGRR
jgi:hypothetical protein